LTIRRVRTPTGEAPARAWRHRWRRRSDLSGRGLRRWLDTAAVAVSEGRVFRRIDRHGNLGTTLSDRRRRRSWPPRVAAAWLEGDFARHSLRAGFATAAARAGRSRPQSCATGAGVACRSPAVTSARAPAGTTIPSPRLASEHLILGAGGGAQQDRCRSSSRRKTASLSGGLHSFLIGQ
jgi:hypothetical protein